jgi:hypothetical protein
MVFRTELDGPVTRNTARQGVDAAYGIPEQHEPLGGRCRGLKPSEKAAVLCL